jgi:hypothetical protein
VQPEAERYEALLAAVQRLVRAPDAVGALAGDAVAWLSEGGLAPGDAAQLAALGPNRLLVYRRHVRRGLDRAIRLEIPRTAARFGGAFAAWVDRWIDEESPRSRYFRDVAFEMVAWAAPRWARDTNVPAYLGDLARHELIYFEVASAPDAADDGGDPHTPGPAGHDGGDPHTPGPAGEIALDRGVCFHASTRLCRYDHAVHRLDAELDARDVPAAEPTALLAYRDAEHDVRFLELTPIAAAILERLLAGELLGPAVVAGCGALAHPVDAAVTGSTAALLGDLLERGVVLGAASPDTPGDAPKQTDGGEAW